MLDNMETLIIIGVVVLPIIIIHLLSHNEDMDTAMNYYKYHITYNSDNSCTVITEKEYLGNSNFYDTHTRKRLIKRSDFTSLDFGKKHYVGGLLSKNLRREYIDNSFKQQNTVKISTLTDKEFENEILKIRKEFVTLDLDILHSKLDSVDLEMKEVYKKQNQYMEQTKKYDMFSFLEDYRQYISIYAEYWALINELDSRNSNHRVIVEHQKYMKEISKLR